MPLPHPPRAPAVLLLMASAACAHAGDDAVRINQIQVIGTHNSYHAGFAPSAMKLLKARAPKDYASLDYTHPPLARQLDDGVRQLELDVFDDAHGGRWAHPAITRLIALAGLPADPPIAPPGVMEKPGFKVMHIQEVDQRSTCQPFTTCLSQIRDWSNAHPDHVPLFVLLETKQGVFERPGLPRSEAAPFDRAAFDRLDQAITSVFPREKLITPDDVRGHYATLDAAVRHDGWPTLARARGKLLFLLDQRAATAVYAQGHAALAGRVAFPNAAPDSAEAAFTECNECDRPAIDALVRRGYLVRARTDDPAQGQGRNDDTRRRDAVLGSGAQMLSTDFPAGEPTPSGYVVRLPGGAVARCNPVLRVTGCRDDALER